MGILGFSLLPCSSYSSLKLSKFTLEKLSKRTLLLRFLLMVYFHTTNWPRPVIMRNTVGYKFLRKHWSLTDTKQKGGTRTFYVGNSVSVLTISKYSRTFSVFRTNVFSTNFSRTLTRTKSSKKFRTRLCSPPRRPLLLFDWWVGCGCGWPANFFMHYLADCSCI